MVAQAGLVVGVGLELVEGGVVLFGDLVLRAQPQGLHGVHDLAVELDGEGDEGAVFLQDLLDAPLLREVLGLVLQVQNDPGATGGKLRRGGEGVGAGALAGPDVGRGVELPGLGEHLNLLGGHESGVETDAELADEVGVFLAAFGEGFEEGFGAGVGDGAEVFDQLLAGHPEAGVLDHQRLGLFIGRDGDLQRAVGVVDGFFGQLEVAKFLGRIGGVGNKFAHKDLLFGVERVDDDIQQLLDLSLEFERLGGGRGGGVGGHGWKTEMGF